MACDGGHVSDDGASVVFYSALPTAKDASEYLASLDTARLEGACNAATLGTGEVTCSFTDEKDESGDALMATTGVFTFSPDAEGDCAGLGYSTILGTSELVWNYTGSDVVGVALYCAEDQTTQVAYMRAALYNGNFELDKQ